MALRGKFILFGIQQMDAILSPLVTPKGIAIGLFELLNLAQHRQWCKFEGTCLSKQWLTREVVNISLYVFIYTILLPVISCTEIPHITFKCTLLWLLCCLLY